MEELFVHSFSGSCKEIYTAGCYRSVMTVSDGLLLGSRKRAKPGNAAPSPSTSRLAFLHDLRREKFIDSDQAWKLVSRGSFEEIKQGARSLWTGRVEHDPSRTGHSALCA